MNCPFCNKELSSKSFNHIYNCKDNTIKDKKLVKFQFISHNYPEFDNKEKVIELYENQLLSLPDLKNRFGISYKNTLFLLDYFNIKKRNISESAYLITTKKYRETCFSKYGVDNASKNITIKEKKKDTFIKHYGVDNIWKSKEYYEWLYQHMMNTYGKGSLSNRNGGINKFYDTLSDDEKRIRTQPMRKAYIEYWNKLTDEEKYILIQKRVKFKETKIETEVSRTLSRLNIPHTKQHWINKNSYDIRISGTNLIIEVNGDFWHANPLIYKDDDILPHPFGKVIAKDLWMKDENKKILAENKGYKIIYIWEKEIKDNKDNLMDFIIKKIKENET